MKVLIVCHANQVRSPVLAALLAAERPHWTVHSAGISDQYRGQPVDQRAMEAIAHLGLPPPPPSRVLEGTDGATYDLILFVDRATREHRRRPRWSRARPAEDAVDLTGDIRDPGGAPSLVPLLPAWRAAIQATAARYDGLAAVRPWTVVGDNPPHGTPAIAWTRNYHHRLHDLLPGSWLGWGEDGGPTAMFDPALGPTGFGAAGWGLFPVVLDDVRLRQTDGLWVADSRAYALAVGPAIGDAVDAIARLLPPTRRSIAYGRLVRAAATYMAVRPALEDVMAMEAAEHRG